MPQTPAKAALTRRARDLASYMASIGKPIAHNEALRAVAVLEGERNEHIAIAKARGEAETSAAEDSSYGAECVVTTGADLQLRCPAFPEDCSYVRVVRERHGRVEEVAYWNEDEWRDAPAEVMGAIIGALKAGTTTPNTHERQPVALNLGQHAVLAAYPNLELIPGVEKIADGMPTGDLETILRDCGDGLFRFLLHEMADCGDSVDEASNALDRALDDIEAVKAWLLAHQA